MLSSNKRYLQWYCTKNLYLAVTQYLLGMSDEEFDRRYPNMLWLRRHLMADAPTDNIIKANRIRTELCVKHVANEDMSEVYTKLVELAEVAGVRYTLPPGSSFVAMMRVAHSIIVKDFKGVFKYYPPIFSEGKFIRVLVCGYADVTASVQHASVVVAHIQKLPTCFYTGCGSEALLADEDSVLLDALVKSDRGPSVSFDVNLTNDWRVFVDTDAALLVDGENITPAAFDVFMRLQFRKKRSVKVPIRIFGDKNEKAAWQYIESRYSDCFDIKTVTVARVARRKSLVDFALVNEVNRLYYELGFRDFFIMSGDSDFSSLLMRFQDVQFSYIVNRSTTSREFIGEIKSCGMNLYMLDESCYYWNKGVFMSNFVVDMASQQPVSLVYDDSSWGMFLRGLGLDPQLRVCKLARAQVNSAVSGDLNKLLDRNKGVS